MHPVIAELGPFTVYSWGLMLALAFIAGLIVALRYAKIEAIPETHILDLFAWVLLASLVGARAVYVAAFWDQFKSDPRSVLFITQGGMAFFGGLAFAMLAVVAYTSIKKLNVLKTLDALSPAAAIGYAIGRIGCYLNGCCYGKEICGIFQQTQLYSSMSGLAIFALLAYFYNRKRYDGQIFLTGLAAYSFLRFLIEFLRFSPIHIWIFTPSQLFAAAVAVISAGILWKKNTTL